ncbi:MAG TPA: secretion protein HlyD [Woeseiaceae bacterium]|nr:secretion protein HlyD [Woeseiaceae bacterium]
MGKRARVAVIAVALAAVIAAWAGWNAWRGDGAETALTLYGNVDIREVELAFRVGGRLQAMEVDEGDRVRQGQRLAALDPEPYRDALAMAEARVAARQANLAKLESGSRPQEVQQARAAVREAEAAFANAERDLRRQEELYESGGSSRKVVDAALALRDATAARLASAREALALALEGPRAEDIAAARAELDVALAERQQAMTRLDDTALVAPADGTILARVREPGAVLPPGATVYTLSLDAPVYVRAWVSEPNLGRIVPGAAVFVTTDSSDRRYRGQVGFVSPRAEFTPRSVETTDLRTDLVYRLRIVVTDADEHLRQGMPVTVSVPLRRKAGG